ADRIAANGDFANKIGTYQLAVTARHHGVKFMVAAPMSTIDVQTPNGNLIPIEERGSQELLTVHGQNVGVANVNTWNPVFDVTPASLVDALVTELGVILNPDASKLAALISRAKSVV
ncbi:methylthioribose-1-phosphate isomerase, partial [Achromatium sp. WMS2]